MHSYTKDPGMKILMPFSFYYVTLCCGEAHSSLIFNVGHLGDLSKKAQGIYTHRRAPHCLLSGHVLESSLHTFPMDFMYKATERRWILLNESIKYLNLGDFL